MNCSVHVLSVVNFVKAENAILFFFAVSSEELSVDEVVNGRPVCVNIESVFVQTNQQVID